MIFKEKQSHGFTCDHCGSFVPVSSLMGTKNRNHCINCLWSKDADIKPGDRASVCQAVMEPVGITLKQEGANKYGNQRLGDIMLIHRCTACGKININRIAADDAADTIMKVFERSLSLPEAIRQELVQQNIILLPEVQLNLLKQSLYGKPNP